MNLQLDSQRYFQEAYSLNFTDFNLQISDSIDLLTILNKKSTQICEKKEDQTKAIRAQIIQKPNQLHQNQYHQKDPFKKQRSHIQLSSTKIQQYILCKKGFAKQTSQLSQNIKSIIVKYFLREIKLKKFTIAEKQAINIYISQGNKFQILKKLLDNYQNVRNSCIKYIDSNIIIKDILMLSQMSISNKLLLLKYLNTWSTYLQQPIGHNQWKGYKLHKSRYIQNNEND